MDKIFIAKILLGTSLLLGTSVAIYKFYPSSEERLMSEMVTKLSDVKTFEYEGGVNMTTNMGAVSGTFSGASDVSDLNDLKSSLLLNIVTNIIGQNTNISLETISIAKMNYIKLNKAPNLGFLDLSKFTNQWIKINTDSLSKQIVKTTVVTEQTKTLTEKQISDLKDLFAKSNIFEITAKLGDEEIYGVLSSHYQFKLNKEEMQVLAKKANEIVTGKKLTAEEAEAMDKAFAMTGEETGEIWIGKEDGLPRKININMIIGDAGAAKISGEMNMSLTFKAFNKEVSIETPTNFKELDTENLLTGKFLLK